VGRPRDLDDTHRQARRVRRRRRLSEIFVLTLGAGAILAGIYAAIVLSVPSARPDLSVPSFLVRQFNPARTNTGPPIPVPRPEKPVPRMSPSDPNPLSPPPARNAGNSATPDGTKTVHQAVRLENVRTTKTSYAAGEPVGVTCVLVNRSNRRIVVPLCRDFREPCYVLGIVQRWLEPLPLPSMAEKAMGKRPLRPAGGEAVIIDSQRQYSRGARPGKHELEAGEAVPLSANVAMPKPLSPGRYRLHVQYKSIRPRVGPGEQPLQTATTDFEVR